MVSWPLAPCVGPLTGCAPQMEDLDYDARRSYACDLAQDGAIDPGVAAGIACGCAELDTFPPDEVVEEARAIVCGDLPTKSSVIVFTHRQQCEGAVSEEFGSCWMFTLVAVCESVAEALDCPATE